MESDEAFICQHLAGQTPAILLRDSYFAGLSELLPTPKPTLFLPSTSNFACFDAYGSDVRKKNPHESHLKNISKNAQGKKI